MGQVDLPAELQHKLVWLVAAALRHYIVQQHGLAAVDGAIEEEAAALIAGHDEGAILEARGDAPRPPPARARPARRRRCSRASLAEGMLPLFIAGLATLTGLEHDAAWEVIADPRGRGPALLLRAAGVGRARPPPRSCSSPTAAARSSRAPRATPPPPSSNCSTASIRRAPREVLRLWRADPGYRASVARISTRARPAAEAA